MNKVKFISESAFRNKYKFPKIDLEKMKLFNDADIIELWKLENRPKIREKLNIFLRSYLKFALKNPGFIKSFVIPRMISSVGELLDINKTNDKSHNLTSFKKLLVDTYNRRVNIALAFQPKTLLEIGTYFGWGAASFKKGIPKCKVYTMSPKDSSVNNPVKENETGYFYKKKNLNIIQIWSDSTKFNYSKLPKIDVVYIDGNHSFDFIYKDLENTSKIVDKCIIIDDYLPKGETNKEAHFYGPWNNDVVKATNDFIIDNPDIFRKIFWIKNTRLCLLIK